MNRRAITALVASLLAVLAYALAAWLTVGGAPPVDFVRLVLVVFVLFLIGSVTCTHRFWMRDR